ncbi:uncharacterized protein LOC144180240 [Haemaphysalis longicornis]
MAGGNAVSRREGTTTGGRVSEPDVTILLSDDDERRDPLRSVDTFDDIAVLEASLLVGHLIPKSSRQSPQPILKSDASDKKEELQRCRTWPEVAKPKRPAASEVVQLPPKLTQPSTQAPRHRFAPSSRSPRPSPRKQRVSETHWAIVVALVTSTTIVLVALVLIALAFATRPDEPKVRHRCTTPGCNALARMLDSSIDASVDPCDNFYRSVCNSRQSNKSVYAEHLSHFIGELTALLRDTRALTRNHTLPESAAQLYRSCESVLLNGRDDRDNFRALLSQAGLVWPDMDSNADLLNVTARIRRHFGLACLLRIAKVPRSFSSGLTGAGIVVEPGCPFNERSSPCDVSALKDSRPFYDAVVNAAARSVNSSLSPNAAFNAGVDIEKDIYSISSSTSRGTVRNAANASEMAEVTPHFGEEQWERFVEETVNAAALPITVVDAGYFVAYGELARKNETTMVWYASWLAVSDIAPLISKDIAALRYSKEPLDEYAAKKICLTFTERRLGVAVFADYVWKTFARDVVEDIRGATLALLPSFRQKIDKTWNVSGSIYDSSHFFWMTEAIATNRLEVATTESMTESVARNSVNAWRLRERLADRGSISIWTPQIGDTLSQDSYSFVDSRKATLRLPLYASLLPLYDRGLDAGIKLGTLGVLYAVGNFRNVERTLSLNDKVVLRERLGCFSGQSGRELYNHDYDRAAPLQLVENILETTLPDTTARHLNTALHFTKSQTFFLAMCYLLCDPASGGGKFERACNEAVRHSRLFSKAFKCSVGSRMNPSDKCRLF